MYAQQANTGIAPLDAVLATAQMVTPDGGNTVAAQVAQAAAQKMQLQGIMQGMPQARQDFRTAAEIDNMKRMQMQQAMQQMAAQMTARPAGIEDLPARNMRDMQRMAGGGVIGYAEGGTPRTYGYAPDYEDARRLGISLSPYDSPEVRQQKLERLQKMREFEEQRKSFGEIPTEASQANERALAQAFSPAAQERRMLEVPTAPGRTAAPPMAASPEGQRLAQRPPTPPAPRPPAPATRPPAAPPAPTGIAAALADRPQYDVASIPAAGAPYMKAGEEDVARLRKAEGERAAFEKTLPDLSAKGIEALQQRMRDVEAAEAARKESAGLDRVIQQLLGRTQGAGGAARADIQFMNAQRAAADAFSQAKLGNQQAQLLLEKAQQERQLGRFDRAIALEKEAAALMEKARDNRLKAEEIAQRSAGAQFQGAVQMRGQDIGVEEGAKERASRERVAQMGIEARAAGAGARGAITPKDLAKFRMQAEQQVDKALQEDMAYRRLRNDPTGQATYRENMIKARVREALIAADYDLPAGYEKAPAPAAGAAMPPGNWGKAQVVTP